MIIKFKRQGKYMIHCHNLVHEGLFATAFLRWPKMDVLLLASIAGNLAIVLFYVFMHYSEVTIGPGAGHTENLEILGIVATAAELGLVMILATRLGGACRRVTFNGLLLAGVLVWTLKLTGLLT